MIKTSSGLFLYGANSTHQAPKPLLPHPFSLSLPHSTCSPQLTSPLPELAPHVIFGIAPKPPLCDVPTPPFPVPNTSTALLFLAPNTPPVPTSLVFTAARHPTLHLHSHITAGLLKKLLSFIHYWHTMLLEL